MKHFCKRSLLFLSRKLVKMTIVVAAVCALSFTLVSLSPVNPVDAYIGADMLNVSAPQRAIIEKRWGLDKSAPERFLKWFSEITRGNFGSSLLYNEPVIRVIGKRFLASLTLMVMAWIFSGLLGFVLGIISGTYKGSLAARVIDLYAYTLASTPVFWIGILLLVVFSVGLQWTPMGGAVPPGVIPGEETFAQRIHHLVLPVLSLSVMGIANITLHTRAKAEEIMQSDYVLFARARGETQWGIITRHCVRNAMLPALSVHFAAINEIFGGSVLVEQVFSFPGVGKAAVDAGIRGDVPLLLGIAIFSTIFVFWGNAIADWFYHVVDPRIRV